MLFVFAYVDIFSFYRADVRADIEAGSIAGLTIDQSFLLATTVYVAVPSLMIIGALVLPPGIARVANIALGAVLALSIVVGAVDQWGYYLLGSVIEVALLATIAYQAWKWPRLAPDAATDVAKAESPRIGQVAPGSIRARWA